MKAKLRNYKVSEICSYYKNFVTMRSYLNGWCRQKSKYSKIY